MSEGSQVSSVRLRSVKTIGTIEGDVFLAWRRSFRSRTPGTGNVGGGDRNGSSSELQPSRGA